MIPHSLKETDDITERMVILESDKIKLGILMLLSDEGEVTIGRIRNKLKTGFRTIKCNCEFLEKIGFIVIETKQLGDRTRTLTFIKLSDTGKIYQQNQQEVSPSKDQIPIEDEEVYKPEIKMEKGRKNQQKKKNVK